MAGVKRETLHPNQPNQAAGSTHTIRVEQISQCQMVVNPGPGNDTAVLPPRSALKLLPNMGQMYWHSPHSRPCWRDEEAESGALLYRFICQGRDDKAMPS